MNPTDGSFGTLLLNPKLGMKRPVLILLVALLAIVASLFWWSKHKDTPPPTAEDPIVTLKVGYIPIIDCSQLYVASQRGYFTEQHLNVELVPMAGGPIIIQALSSGAIDIGFANLATVVFYENGSPVLRRLSGGTRMDKDHSEAGLVVLASSSINVASDLKGKIVAVNSRKNIVDLAVLRFIRGAGLKADDITLVEVPFKDMEAALRGGRIDAATLPEPILSVAMKTDGLRNLGDHFVMAFGSISSTGYFAMPTSEKITESVAQRFKVAMERATEELNSADSGAWTAVAEVTKLPPDVLAAAGKPEFLNAVSSEAFLQMKTWLQEEGLMTP